MEKTIKMYIKSNDGKKLEQEIPSGLVGIYLEKGWIEIEEPQKIEKEEKSFFGTKKTNKFKTKK